MTQLRRLALGALALTVAVVAPPGERGPPPNWDGLVLTPSRRIDLVYLRPQADFSVYRKVMLDRPEIAYDKEWRRHYNSSTSGLGARLTDHEIRKLIDDGRMMLIDAYSKEFQKAGYAIVDKPDTDVMRLFVGLANVQITAPEPLSPGVKTYSEEIGRATLVLEVRDSLSGTLLGRAVDQRVLEDSIPMLRTEADNRAEFQGQFREWARLSAKGLNDLRSAAPLR